MVPTTATGEVLVLNQADQFQPGESQFECGYFACAMIRSGAPVGHLPIRTVQQVIDDGEMWYAQYTGSDSISNMSGMSLDQLYQLIRQMTYDYRPIDLSNNPIEYIRAWVRLGFPVIIAGAETGFLDMGLGDVVPYLWHPSGNHIIDVTGIAADGNFIVRDSANVTDLYNPTTLRPGPRKYDASKLQLVSATAVVMPWLPKPPAGFDPTKESLPQMSVVPSGWFDLVVNGDPQLFDPQKKYFVRGAFRSYILNYPGGWHSWNVPKENSHHDAVVEQSNPALGPGWVQTFENTRLEWLDNSQKLIEGWVGQELEWYVQKLAAVESADASAQAAIQKQLNDCQAALAACQALGGGIPTDLQTAINQVAMDLSKINNVISIAQGAVNDATPLVSKYVK